MWLHCSVVCSCPPAARVPGVPAGAGGGGGLLFRNRIVDAAHLADPAGFPVKRGHRVVLCV